jgi:hypothetical protein
MKFFYLISHVFGFEIIIVLSMTAVVLKVMDYDATTYYEVSYMLLLIGLFVFINVYCCKRLRPFYLNSSDYCQSGGRFETVDEKDMDDINSHEIHRYLQTIEILIKEKNYEELDLVIGELKKRI